MVSTKDKLEFVYLMAKHSKLGLYQLQRIMRYGATHKRLMEQACNVGLTPLEELKVKQVRGAILNIICPENNAIFGGDPRGATVKIQVPDGRTNDWGQEGICVPTS